MSSANPKVPAIEPLLVASFEPRLELLLNDLGKCLAMDNSVFDSGSFVVVEVW